MHDADPFLYQAVASPSDNNHLYDVVADPLEFHDYAVY